MKTIAVLASFACALIASCAPPPPPRPLAAPALGPHEFDACPFVAPASLPAEPAPSAECAGDGAEPPLTWEQRFRTPRADVEAEWLSLLADDVFTASEERYQRTACELARIRAVEPAVTDVDNSAFIAGGRGILVTVVGVDAPSLQPFRCVNASIDGAVAGNPARAVVFDGLYNPRFTTTLYRATPGVAAASIDGVPGDHNEIRAIVVDEGTTRYGFLRRVGDDCQVGCPVGELYVFDADVGGTITYVVHWIARDGALPADFAPFAD